MLLPLTTAAASKPVSQETRQRLVSALILSRIDSLTSDVDSSVAGYALDKKTIGWRTGELVGKPTGLSTTHDVTTTAVNWLH